MFGGPTKTDGRTTRVLNAGSGCWEKTFLTEYSLDIKEDARVA